MDKMTIKPSIGKYTIYASEYCRLDSDVITGGGTDDTDALQAILDMAPVWGRLRVILDGAALVRGIKIHSNTTLECQDKSCGLYLADDSDCAIVINANPTYGEIINKNITLLGGTYNHNCLHQKHHIDCDDPKFKSNNPDPDADSHWTVAVEVIGVENLNVRDLTVRDQRTFAFTVGNFKHVNIENTYIELENEIIFGNQDGFHFWGPGQFLTMKNVGGKTEDDFMNIGPDERDGVSSITDVLIDGVMLDGAWQAVRLLSRGSGLLDRVTVKNVTGTYRCYGFYINPWFVEDTLGNFGHITFENINLKALDNPFDGIENTNEPFLFYIGGDIKSLTFKDIKWNGAYDSRNIFKIGYPYHDERLPLKEKKPCIDFMLIDGLQIFEDADDGMLCDGDYEYILARGTIRHLAVRDADIFRNGNVGHKCTLIKTTPDCEIGRLSLSRIYAENLDCMTDNSEGRINNITTDEIYADGCVMLKKEIG